VAMNYGNEEHVLGDDEIKDNNGTDHEETSYYGDVIMPSDVISNVGTLSINLRPRHRSRVSQ
jgi:hypothetical protein